jgi:Tfp pilus assembly protein PilN
MKNMLEPYYRISHAAGVNIHLRQDGVAHIHACSVIAKGNQLDIDKKVLDISSVEGLSKHFQEKTPIALNLSGKGILHKQIERTETIDQGNFNKILPNAGIDDFYVQHFISGDLSFVSVIRKTEADRWINQLIAQGYVPLSLSLGPLPVEHIIPQLNIYESGLQFGGNIIQRDEHSHWTNYRYDETALAPFPLKIESEGIDEKLVVPYAVAFQLILGNQLDIIQAEVPLLNDTYQSKLSDQKLKVNGILVLSVFFVLLLINLVIFSWLNSSNIQLASKVSRFTQNTSNVQDINEQIKQKEALLQSLGWDGGINKSVLIDQLASLMPEEISLTEIAITPIDLNSSRAQRSLIFFERRISITGTSGKIIPVNEWMARIKTRPWVKNIQMESYAYNNELNTGQFIITLNY